MNGLISSDKRDFLHKMRDYMPPAHKDFIEKIAEVSKVKHCGRCLLGF